MPIEKMRSWIEEEKNRGSIEADSVVLATASSRGEVHSRVVAIRELNDSSILFFTQKQSRKAKDLSENPSASMTLWLPMQQREVVLDGKVEALLKNENEHYWTLLPRERKLRFISYKSRKPIDSLAILQADYDRFDKEFDGVEIPMGESYCGYRFIPDRMYFYTLGKDTFSEVIQYALIGEKWNFEHVSP